MVSVQNLYNLADRHHEDVVDYCTENGIAFIPWFPLATGKLAGTGGVLDEAAKRHGVTPAQLALAWVLQRSPRDASRSRAPARSRTSKKT